MINTSLKQQVDIFGGVTLYPHNPTTANYSRLFNTYHFARLPAEQHPDRDRLGRPSAWCWARSPRTRWPASTCGSGSTSRRWWWRCSCACCRRILLVIPLYIMLAKWGLLNTRLGLILIYTGLNTSFVIWMMQSFLAEIPRDIEEAAMVDGDTRLTALWRVVLPLAAPGLAATAIFSVIATYNDFLIALSLTSTPTAQTVPVGVSTLIGKIQIEYGPMAAAGVVGALPIVIFALLVQRHFVRGLTLGAVK